MSPDGLDILWFGRADLNYSRNRVVRQAMADLGHHLHHFSPGWKNLSHWQARLQKAKRPDVVWVPCFRQRDMVAAAKLAKGWRVPLVFDPLISAYDKQVFERGKFAETSKQALKLLAKERAVMGLADWVVADTADHAAYFQETLQVRGQRLWVVPVGAEGGLFEPKPLKVPEGRLQVLFYGSFIGLQGPEVIVEAAKHAPDVDWTLLGKGPLKEACQAKKAQWGLANVRFEDPLPYEQLPDRVAQAAVLLGVFAESAKAGRVVPNKVYQAMASGRVVVSRRSNAYPKDVLDLLPEESGLFQVAPADPQALAQSVNHLDAQRDQLPTWGQQAARTYAEHMGPKAVQQAVAGLLKQVVDG